jgi:hypothetical protein
MPDKPDNILLAYLRRFDEKLDKLIETQADHGRRLTLLEIAVSNLAASEMGHYATFPSAPTGSRCGWTGSRNASA